MKKAIRLIFLVLCILISSTGLALAQECLTYLVDVRTDYDGTFQDCMLFCDAGGGYMSFYSDSFGEMWGSFGNLGTDHKTVILWGDGTNGIAGAFIFKLKGPHLLSGEGVCPTDCETIFQFHGKASSCLPNGG